MRIPFGLVVMAALGAASAAARPAIIPVASDAERLVVGAFTPEGPRLREQLWLIPSGPADTSPRLRATVFRPPGPGPFPVAVVNHPTAGSPVDRIAFPLPTYFFLSRFLVERGYAVVLPLRRGYGGSEGAFVETIGPCTAPVYDRAAEATADDIEAVIDFMLSQSFIERRGALVVGIAGGGWGGLAVAGRSPTKVAALVGFGTGRGAIGAREPGRVCAPERLYDAARRLGAGTRVPSLWFHAEDDQSISIDVARALHTAYRESGGTADFVATGAVGNNQGQNLVGEWRAIRLWQPRLREFLDRVSR